MFTNTVGFYSTPSSIHVVEVPPLFVQDGDGDVEALSEASESSPAGPTTLTVRCVSELTPLDMIDLSCGTADATGHKVWLGASLFVAFLWKAHTLRRWMQGRVAIELGCGTGLGGLSLAAATNARLVVLTDGHAGVAELAAVNAKDNVAATGNTAVEVRRLEWGQGYGEPLTCQEHRNAAFVSGEGGVSDPATDDAPKSQKGDLILICDAIYDESVVEVLVQTAASLLKYRDGASRIYASDGNNDGSSGDGGSEDLVGLVIISHVPRCADDAEVRRRIAAAATSEGLHQGKWLSAEELFSGHEFTTLETEGRNGQRENKHHRDFCDVGASIFVASTNATAPLELA